MAEAEKTFKKGTYKYYDDAMMKEIRRKNKIVLDIMRPYHNLHFTLAMVVITGLLLFAAIQGLKWYFILGGYAVGFIVALLYSVTVAAHKTVTNPAFREYVDSNGKDYSKIPKLPTDEERKQLFNKR